MLSLLDPVELEDIVIFRDDVEANKFYPLPDQPIIPLDDQRNPEFLFIKYIKDTDSLAATDRNVGGGIVQFRSVLTMDPARRQKIVEALKQRLETEKAASKTPFGHPITSTEPLLAAPLWTSGKVTLATFKVSDTGLVRFATDSAPVDLAGDLGASLSLELDEVGGEVFWSAFKSVDQRQIPIMVTYQLTYKARVSAKMTIHAERRVIHQRILQRAQPYQLITQGFVRYVPMVIQEPFVIANLPKLRALARAPVLAMVSRPQILEVVNQTIVNNEINVTIETDESTGTGGTEVRDAMFKLATQILSDRVVPALFGEDASRPGATSATQDRPNVDLVQVSENADAQGNVTFDLTFDHLSTIERSINPNGPIQFLISQPETLQNCFKELRLSDGFFRLMNVSATTTGVNFAEDGIEAVHVLFEYDQIDEADPRKPSVRRLHDDTLKSEKDVLYWRFDTARSADGSHKRNYRYMTEVFYREGPSTKSDWITSNMEKLLITPRGMGALRVEAVLTAPESVITSARVLLKHDAPSGAKYSAALELSPKDSRQTWFQYTGELTGNDADLNPPEYTYQVIYRTAGSEVTGKVIRSSAKIVEIASPFKKILTFTLRPQGSFDSVRDISGDLIYSDPERQYEYRQPFQLSSLTAVVNVSVPILDGGPEKARWKAVLNRADGSTVDIGSGDADPGTIFIGRQPLKVDVVADLVDFDNTIQLAVVQLAYNDDANNISEQKTLTFSKTAKGQQSWIINRAPNGPKKYDVDVRFIAYDRAKSSEIKLKGIEDQMFLLEPPKAIATERGG